MKRLGLLLLCLGCRDRGQDVTGGGWAGTSLEQRARYQAEREATQVESAPPAPVAAPTSVERRAGVPDVAPDAPGINPQAAIALLDRPLAADDFTTEAILAEARRLAAADRLPEALSEVARAKVREPNGPAVLLVEGWLLARTGDHRGALAAYAGVLRARPDDDEALYGKALAHLALNDRSSAVPLVERLREKRPKEPRIQRLAARIAPAGDRLRASAQAAATGDPAALREHADALLDAGQPRDAVDFYALAAAQRRNDVDLHLRWGLALAALDRPAEAEAPLKRVTELAPDRTAAWQGLLERTPGDAAGAIRRQIARLSAVPEPPRPKE